MIFEQPCSGHGEIAGETPLNSLLPVCCPAYMSLPEDSTGRNVMDTRKIYQHLTAKIVGSYVRHHTIGAGQLSDLITTVHRALGEVGQPIHPEELRIPAVSVRRSVHQDYVVCLDCGYMGKTLRRHINRQHGLSRDEYRKRWGLRNDHPLTAPAYTERRSILAKEFGLGRKPKAQAGSAMSPPGAPKPLDSAQELEATPTRRRRSRSASNNADVAN
jgi:predicted transcriptional regulator